jgi:hypothetical protein
MLFEFIEYVQELLKKFFCRHDFELWLSGDYHCKKCDRIKRD